jgi:hypothetical protein
LEIRIGRGFHGGLELNWLLIDQRRAVDDDELNAGTCNCGSED